MKIESDEAKELRLRTHISINGITIQDCVDLFLIIYKNKNKITSYITCKRMLLNHFLNCFEKNKLVVDLTELDFLTWQKSIESLDVDYEKRLICYVKKMFQIVQDYYSYKCIPAFRLIVKRRSYNNTIQNKQEIIYTYGDFKKFIKQVHSVYDRTLFETMFYLGLRIGEIRGLQWRDLIGNILYINRSATSKVCKGFTLIDVKSEYSLRAFKLPPFLRADILKIKKKAGTSEFIFFTQKDSKQSISETSIRRKLVTYAEKSNLPYLHPHRWRHSCASYLINDLKANIYQVKEYLGHQDIDTTSRVYIHCYGRYNDNISKLIQDTFITKK